MRIKISKKRIGKKMFTPLENSMWYIYVIKSKKDSCWYTGITNDLRKRIKQRIKDFILRYENKGPEKENLMIR